MTRSYWEMQEGPLRRIRATFDAHRTLDGDWREEFEEAKARTVAALEQEIEAARAVTFERFAAGYLPEDDAA